MWDYRLRVLATAGIGRAIQIKIFQVLQTRG